MLSRGLGPKAEQRAAKAEEKGAFTLETIGRQWVESHQMLNEDHRKGVLEALKCIFILTLALRIFANLR